MCVCVDELTPPPSLLDMVVGWITEDPRLLLLTFINTPLSSSLPLGCLEATPLAGLLRWCVKAPLASQRARKSAVTGVQPEQENGAVCEELYSKLHLSVLQVFLMLQVLFLLVSLRRKRISMFRSLGSQVCSGCACDWARCISNSIGC